MTKETYRDILEWDVMNWSRAIDFWEKTSNHIAPLSRLALDLGARNGGLSLYWALKGYHVICSDVTDSAFDKARALHDRYHVRDQIEYQAIDALHIPYRDFFDVITFKSVLGGIANHNVGFEKAEETMKQIYRALKPGGYLCFCENLQGSKIHMILRHRLRNHGKRWHYFTIEELRNITGAFENFSYDTYGLTGALAKGSVGTFLSKMDAAVDHLFPETSRYLISVVCRKPVLP